MLGWFIWAHTRGPLGRCFLFLVVCVDCLQLGMSIGPLTRGPGPICHLAGRAWALKWMPIKERVSRSRPIRFAGQTDFVLCGSRVCGLSEVSFISILLDSNLLEFSINLNLFLIFCFHSSQIID